MDIVAFHGLAETNRVIAKLLNHKDSQYILEKKYKLRNITLHNHNESENSNSGKIFINQSLCPCWGILQNANKVTDRH